MTRREGDGGLRVPNLAISASAGSGKTFRLAHRYVQLLALGVEPERIAALTFSRKAAGEIFDTIVERLCLASASAEEAAATARRIGWPGMGSGAFRSLLRALLDAMPRLQVGTLDSFAVAIVGAFPFELGIAMEFEVMDTEGAAAQAARQEVLRGILQRRETGDAAGEAFLEAFKQATFGREEKGLGRALDTFIRDFYTTFQAVPAERAGGDERVIWARGSPWIRPVKDIEGAAERLRGYVAGGDWPPSVAGRRPTGRDRCSPSR